MLAEGVGGGGNQKLTKGDRQMLTITDAGKEGEGGSKKPNLDCAESLLSKDKMPMQPKPKSSQVCSIQTVSV